MKDSKTQDAVLRRFLVAGKLAKDSSEAER